MFLKTLLHKALTTITGLQTEGGRHSLANSSPCACDGVSAYRSDNARINDTEVVLRERGLESAGQAPRLSLLDGKADASRAIAASDPGPLGGLGKRPQVNAQNPPDRGLPRHLLSFDSGRKPGVRSAFKAWRPRGWGIDDRVARLLRAGGEGKHGGR